MSSRRSKARTSWQLARSKRGGGPRYGAEELAAAHRVVDLVNDSLDELWPLLNQLSLGSVPWLAIERALHRRLAEYHGLRTPPSGIGTQRLSAAAGRRRAEPQRQP